MNNSLLPHSRSEPTEKQNERVRQMADQVSTEIHRKMLLENIAYTFRQMGCLKLNLSLFSWSISPRSPGQGKAPIYSRGACIPVNAPRDEQAGMGCASCRELAPKREEEG